MSASGVRWWASKGRFWGAARPPVETGTANPHDRQSVGYRSWKCQEGPGADFKGDVTVRMEGCHACPIRCHACWEIPSAEKWGVSRYSTNTCSGTAPSNLLGSANHFQWIDGEKSVKDGSGNKILVSDFENKLRKAENNVVAIAMADDLCITMALRVQHGYPWFLDAEGLWCKETGLAWTAADAPPDAPSTPSARCTSSRTCPPPSGPASTLPAVSSTSTSAAIFATRSSSAVWSAPRVWHAAVRGFRLRRRPGRRPRRRPGQLEGRFGQPAPLPLHG